MALNFTDTNQELDNLIKELASIEKIQEETKHKYFTNINEYFDFLKCLEKIRYLSILEKELFPKIQ